MLITLVTIAVGVGLAMAGAYLTCWHNCKRERRKDGKPVEHERRTLRRECDSV